MSRLIREPVTKLPTSVNPPPPKKKAPKRPVFPLRLPAGGRERGRGVGGARRCGAAGSYLREMSAPTDSPGSSLLHARARAPLKSICAFIYRTLALMDFCQAAPNHQGLLEGGGPRARSEPIWGARSRGSTPQLCLPLLGAALRGFIPLYPVVGSPWDPPHLPLGTRGRSWFWLRFLGFGDPAKPNAAACVTSCSKSFLNTHIFPLDFPCPALLITAVFMYK